MNYESLPLGPPWTELRARRLKQAEEFLLGKGPRPQHESDLLDVFRYATLQRKRKIAVSLRMDEWVIGITKAISKKHGVGYLHCYKLWIEDGIRRALEEGLKAKE